MHMKVYKDSDYKKLHCNTEQNQNELNTEENWIWFWLHATYYDSVFRSLQSLLSSPALLKPIARTLYYVC